MEGAAYSLQVHPETMMRLYLDKLIAVMAAAQWEDGYLYTFYSLPERQPEKRWTNEKDMHEQYCMGHMLEAAVAHYQVTGNKSFLDIATRCADYVCDRLRPGQADRSAGTSGDRDRPVQALSRHRRRQVPRHGQVPPRPARPAGQSRTRRQGRALRPVRPGPHPGDRADRGGRPLGPGRLHVYRHGRRRGPDGRYEVRRRHRHDLGRRRRRRSSTSPAASAPPAGTKASAASTSCPTRPPTARPAPRSPTSSGTTACS